MEKQAPESGPSGYLPPRAAKRARKIVMREPLGLGWVIAALVAGALVIVAGGAFLLLRADPPGPPYERAAEIAAIDPRGAEVVATEEGSARVLVLRAAGGIAVFSAPGDAVQWCPESNRLESSAGHVWEPNGRLVGGDGDSLARLPAQAHGGVLYVDVSAEGARRTPQQRGETTQCASPATGG